MPGLRTHLEMDRGLYLVVQTRPDVYASHPIPVRHPVPSRCPIVMGRLPPGIWSPIPRCHTATSLASIRLDLRLAKYLNISYIWLTFKNTCRARHTQSAGLGAGIVRGLREIFISSAVRTAARSALRCQLNAKPSPVNQPCTAENCNRS